LDRAAECAWLPTPLDVLDAAAADDDAPWLAEYRAAVAAAAAASPASRKRAARWLARQERFVAAAEAAAERDVDALEASIDYNVAALRARTEVGAVDEHFARHFAAAWRAAPRRPEPPTDLDDDVDDEAALRPRLPRYRGPADVAVARTEARAAALANAVRESGDAVVGFDVEYATLEGDLRQVPALVSLASARGVALFWLDKLPGRGRRALSVRAPLGALLADRSVAKAGVGASRDAAKLEAFGDACVVRASLDLGDGDSLADLCRSVLGRDLGKRKTRRRRDEKRSHWRAPDLTAAMRVYAAEDAACARDVHAATVAAADPDAATPAARNEAGAADDLPPDPANLLS